MKVLVIDDEHLVRETVVHLLETFGISDIIEADDGHAGLQLVQEQRPDLAIVDVRMPGLGGIELLERLKQLNIQMPYVMLSGYDLFSYAQTALNLGATAYLLKPVNPDELYAVIQKVRLDRQLQDIRSETAMRTNIQLKQSMEIMRRRFIGELAATTQLAEGYVAGRLKELEIGFAHRQFAIVRIELDPVSGPASGLPSNDQALIQYGAENIACEILQQADVGVWPGDAEQGFFLLANIPLSVQYPRDLMSLCTEVKESIRHYLRQHATIGIGSLACTLSELPSSYEAAGKALLQRLVKGTGSVIVYERPVASPDQFKGIGFQVEQDMLLEFERGDQAAAMAIVRRMYEPFIALDFIDRASLLKLNFQLIVLLFKILERFDAEPAPLLGEELSLYEEVNQCTSIEAMLDWFGGKLALAFDALLSNRETGARKLIEKARGYIHNRYMEDLSLETVAAHVYVTPAYFSSIFKKETGKNFVDYVSHYRIDKAKQLLGSGNYKVNAVAAMTGFHNMKYFYKVFKKQTGLTPNQYKEL